MSFKNLDTLYRQVIMDHYKVFGLIGGLVVRNIEGHLEGFR